MRTKITGIAFVIFIALVFTIPAFAGGWATITLDELPANVTTGKPLEIGFTVRQHGHTPLEGLKPTVIAKLTGSKESVSVFAKEEGKPGHYVASLTFPQSGEWSWKITAFGEQTMPPLSVATAPLVTKSESVPAPTISISYWVVGILGIASLIIGLFMFKTKTRWALVLVLAGLIVSGVGFASASGQAEVKVEAQESSIDMDLNSQVEYGRDLFIAKGCITCHRHDEVKEYAEFQIDAGPNLTEFSAVPEYLEMRLKDPTSVKSDTKMPQLELSESEIAALIAFINSD